MVRNPLDVGGPGFDDEKGEVPGEHAGEELEMETEEFLDLDLDEAPDLF